MSATGQARSGSLRPLCARWKVEKVWKLPGLEEVIRQEFFTPVPLFRLKQLCPPAANDPIHWNYDRAEVIADGIIHALGISFGLVGATTLFLIRPVSTSVDPYVIAVYAAALLTMLVLSATYNLWPVSPRKWFLRRLDHSAIFLVIAATYTPFIWQLTDRGFVTSFLVGVWGVALAGMILKLNFPGRFDNLSIGLYLAMGWSGILAYDKVGTTLPISILVLIANGGGLYTLGVLFHSWQRLRFQNAIWHGFVVLGAGCHFIAVVGLVTA
jgi:hemolysin III